MRREPEEKPKTPEKEDESVIELRKSGPTLVDTKLNRLYRATLNAVDITTGHNSFLILEIIYAEKTFHLLRKWGRTGTRGEHKIEIYQHKTDAVKKFCDLYWKKTENKWEDCANFTKKPSKYFHHVSDDDLMNGEETSQARAEIDWDRLSKMNLDESVKSTLHVLFDIQKMESQLKNFEVN